MRSVAPVVIITVLLVITTVLIISTFNFIKSIINNAQSSSTQQIGNIIGTTYLEILQASLSYELYDNFEYLDTNRWKVNRHYEVVYTYIAKDNISAPFSIRVNLTKSNWLFRKNILVTYYIYNATGSQKYVKYNASYYIDGDFLVLLVDYNITKNDTIRIYLFYGNSNEKYFIAPDKTNSFQLIDYSTLSKEDYDKYECVIKNGILWLVRKSKDMGCNIRAKNLRIKWNDNITILFRFKIDYVCGTANDGDGMAIIIDGRSDSPSRGCVKGFMTSYQGIVIELFTDAPTGTYKYNGISIDDESAACTQDQDRTKANITSIYGGNKSYDLNDGIIKITLNGTHVKVWYYDLNPENGLKEGFAETSTWNPDGKGYLMIGAGVGHSACPTGRDSAHGIDWILISKEEYPLHITIYNPSKIAINLNNTYLAINNCVQKLIYGKTFVTNKGRPLIYSNEVLTLKILPFCELRSKNFICLIYKSGRSCKNVEIPI